MAHFKQISYGSRGNEVTGRQKLRNQNGGYNLETDGIFGDKTKAAVTVYQAKNSLAKDGIVGENTWGALTKAQTQAAAPAQSAEPAAPAQTQPQPPAFSYEEYKPSDTVAQAQALIQQQMAQKPGPYQSTWEGQLNDTILQILNRDKFSYDVNRDALYQQYADQYVRQGKLAMMDAMGQAAALTGGYGSSYGQSVGQQAYQGYLQQLNEVVPELYGMAIDQYNQEGKQLYDQAALMAQKENQDYGRYMDSLNAYLTERDYLAGRYDTERSYDYEKWLTDRNMAYQQDRDKVADQQWQKEYDFAMQQYLDSQKAKSGGSGSRGNDGDKPDIETRYPTDVERAEIVGKIKNELAVESGANISTLADYIAELDAEGYDESFTDELFGLYRYLFEKEKASAVDSNEQRIPKKSADKFRANAKQ